MSLQKLYTRCKGQEITLLARKRAAWCIRCQHEEDNEYQDYKYDPYVNLTQLSRSGI